jgi:hypothetical protein
MIYDCCKASNASLRVSDSSANEKYFRFFL